MEVQDFNLIALDINRDQAAVLRRKFATFTDWNDEAMNVYDDYDKHKSELDRRKFDNDLRQRCRPDEFFNFDQIHRLAQLMEKLHEALAENQQLSAEESEELQQLIETELEASGKRAEKWAAEIGR